MLDPFTDKLEERKINLDYEYVKCLYCQKEATTVVSGISLRDKVHTARIVNFCRLKTSLSEVVKQESDYEWWICSKACFSALCEKYAPELVMFFIESDLA
jgi:hypothetical protein